MVEFNDSTRDDLLNAIFEKIPKIKYALGSGWPDFKYKFDQLICSVRETRNDKFIEELAALGLNSAAHQIFRDIFWERKWGGFFDEILRCHPFAYNIINPGAVSVNKYTSTCSTPSDPSILGLTYPQVRVGRIGTTPGFKSIGTTPGFKPKFGETKTELPFENSLSPASTRSNRENDHYHGQAISSEKSKKSTPPPVLKKSSEGVVSDPPRSAYARLDCPADVLANHEFELELGLSKHPRPGVKGQKLRRPDSSVGPYTLAISLIHDGFILREGESNTQQLSITSDEPYPSVKLHLTAIEASQFEKVRSIMAYFSVNHRIIGSAVRDITVVSCDEKFSALPQAKEMNGIDLSVPSSTEMADLTIIISKGNKTSGDRLVWCLESRHELNIPPSIKPIDIGEKPEEFAKRLMARVEAKEGESDLYPFLVGVGQEIADEIPSQVRQVLRDLYNRVDHPAAVLILTSESYVPWELAYLDLGSDRTGFFASEFVVGRWVIGLADTDGRPKPPPPKTELNVASITVVSGIYDKGWDRLEAAEKEAETIEKVYKASKLNATLPELLDYFGSERIADLLHFSLHGQYDGTGTKDGLAMIDNRMLEPTVVRGYRFKGTPFVFLNACQVGQGNKILGNYAGMASAFLFAGASAVIAPLWSIKDTLARQIAEDFYSEIKKGKKPGEIMRLTRSKFQKANAELSGTFLAYQFFGHPCMHLELGNLTEGELHD